jgi:hypothetical protein
MNVEFCPVLLLYKLMMHNSSFIRRNNELGMMACFYSLRIWKGEARESQVQGHFGAT